MQRFIQSLIFVIIAYGVQAQDEEINAVDILEKTVEYTRQIKTLNYTMTKIERIDGELIKQITNCKINREPLKVYLWQQYPKEGMEVLYTGGEKALINPNGFPWFNLKLSPLGNMVRENQHHTLLESGYDHVVNIFEHIMKKYADEVHTMLKIEKDTVWDNQPVWKIDLYNPHYEIESYELQPNETVMQVARRDLLSEYWLVEQNPEIKSFDDKKPGTIIKKPNVYAPSMKLYIDKNRYIPMVMKIYDNEGLFEHYTYTGVTVDPIFEEAEFEKDYPNYGF